MPINNLINNSDSLESIAHKIYAQREYYIDLFCKTFIGSQSTSVQDVINIITNTKLVMEYDSNNISHKIYLEINYGEVATDHCGDSKPSVT